MSTEENKAIVRRFYEELNTGNTDTAVELLTATAVIHQSGTPGPLDRDTFKQLGGLFFAAFPDARHEIEDMIAEADQVVTRFTFRGTHRGNLMDIPPTGKQVTVSGIALDRIAGGNIVERRIESDQLGLLQQLGAIPAPGQSGV
jgi:steroid delta-isomerase-like uncharacterized protein